jgi:hypothetical protein
MALHNSPPNPSQVGPGNEVVTTDETEIWELVTSFLRNSPGADEKKSQDIVLRNLTVRGAELEVSFLRKCAHKYRLRRDENLGNTMEYAAK